MELILNTNELGYLPFLDTNATAFIIGLKNFCINQKYCLSINKLENAINEIHNKGKKIYLSINTFAGEKQLTKFKKIISKLSTLNIDGFIVSDLGILNVLKEHNLESKINLDLQTYVTNKYSAKSLLNLGVNSISLSKEITLQDIKEISLDNDGKVEVLVQGYYPITYSKRRILNCFYKNFKLKGGNKVYLKEENRDSYYLLEEENNILSIYNEKQYSLFPYLPDLMQSNIKYLRIDTNYLDKSEIIEYINIYNKAITLISNSNLDEFNSLKEEFINKYSFDTPFIHNESFLLKEGK